MQEDLSFPAVLVVKKGKQGHQGGEGVWGPIDLSVK
jgi:hypothetical protein